MNLQYIFVKNRSASVEAFEHYAVVKVEVSSIVADIQRSARNIGGILLIIT